MVEDILVQQVRFIEEEDGVRALLGEIFDMRGYRVEDRRRRR